MKGQFILLSLFAVLALSAVPPRDELKLDFVQIITRHGARVAFDPLPNEQVWNCSLVNLGVSVIGQHPAPVLYRKKYMEGRQVLPGDCGSGALTSIGWKNHLVLGKIFRNRYVDKLNFLPSTINSSLLFIRSTDSPRTIASVQANLLGLYPTDKRPQNTMIDILTIDSQREDILPSTSCGKLNDACNKIQLDDKWKNNTKSLDGLEQKLKSAWNVTTLPWWIGIWDNLHARIYHQLVFPPQIDIPTYNKLTEAVLWQLKHLYRPADIKRLGIGRFLAEIVEAVDGFYKGDIAPVRYIHYSAHDNTLALILSSLDMLDSITVWPKFASSIQFEFYSDSAKNQYVKMLYNTNEMVIPRCSAQGLCPLSIFKKILSQSIPTNYDEECKSATPQPVPKEVAEVTQFMC